MHWELAASLKARAEAEAKDPSARLLPREDAARTAQAQLGAERRHLRRVLERCDVVVAEEIEKESRSSPA